MRCSITANTARAHGHPDKLQLLLFVQGREWLLDPGRLDYSHKEHKTWYRQTVAAQHDRHQRSQPVAHGRPPAVA